MDEYEVKLIRAIRNSPNPESTLQEVLSIILKHLLQIESQPE